MDYRSLLLIICFFFRSKNKNWGDERQKNVTLWTLSDKGHGTDTDGLIRPLLFSLLFKQNLWVACLLWRSTLTSWIWQSWLTCLTRSWLRFLLILTRRPTASHPQVTLDWLTNFLAVLLWESFYRNECKCGKRNARRNIVKVYQGRKSDFILIFDHFKCNIEYNDTFFVKRFVTFENSD